MMAPIKRKPTSEPTSKRPKKKPRQEGTALKAIVPASEQLFPRGGGGSLTPLERKQIQVQATQDVLFEQETGKKVTHDEYGHEDSGVAPTEAASETKKRGKRSKHSKKDNAVDEVEPEVKVRIEGLSYKRLFPGSMVLGQVVSINRYDVSLALPNNLTGFIPLTLVSDKTTQALESIMEEDEESEHISNADISPGLYFYLGQYLRAKVMSTRKELMEGQSPKKHIELSVHPRETNRGLFTNVHVGSTIQGSVLSVEDHGIIMDLGFDDSSTRGFLPKSDLPPDLDASKICEGAVLLCLITGSSANGKTIKLSANPQKIGEMQKKTLVANAPTVDVLLPGTAVEFVVSAVTDTGLLGKAMGLVDITADLIHSKAALSEKTLAHLFPPNKKARGRIICTFPASEGQKVAVSMLDHVIGLKPMTIAGPDPMALIEPLQALPLSSTVEQAEILKVLPGIGLFVKLGVAYPPGFVHISRISDDKIETLTESTGKYKLGSMHKCRIVGYNPMDRLYIVSLEKSIIDQPFLRIEDVNIGQVVKGRIEKLVISEHGVTGILIKLADGITALVPETHLSDTKLQHPEQRFKEGKEVKARVLSVDLFKRQIRLTMKNTLISSDRPPWTSYDNLTPGLRSPGTIINLLPSGAVMQFYGSVRAFLPASEMSESFIEDPRIYFRIGQVLDLWILSVEPPARKLLVTCKDPQTSKGNKEDVFSNLAIGDIVSGSVIEKIGDEIVLELAGIPSKGKLSNEHLVDGSAQKAASAAKRIRISQVLNDLLVLNKSNGNRLAILSSKPSLVSAAKMRQLPKSIEEVVEGAKIDGFVDNVTDAGAFIRFAGSLTGLLPKSKMLTEWISLPRFSLRKDQSISVAVSSIDYLRQRFLLTNKPTVGEISTPAAGDASSGNHSITNPADGVSTSLDEFALNKLTKAKITSVKDTQINVQLADNIQGRIDASEIFDKFEDIHDPSKPLKAYHKNQILSVRIMGVHDSRNHRFLPISHRGKAPVFELTAKPKKQTSEKLSILTLDKVHPGEEYVVFVNNVRDDHLWVNLSPNVRGRIAAMDCSDDVSRMNDLSTYFPIGSALRARVTNIDVANDRLDLTTKLTSPSKAATLEDLSPGLILPGRVTKVAERQIIVQLSESVSGPVHLVDLSDDYSLADPSIYHKNQFVRICIKNVNPPDKRITLSLRPSRVLSSELPVTDPDIASISQVKLNGVYRGFVKNVADTGLFVSLASNITAFVRVSDLSDDFLKNWKAEFEIGQLVKGKVLEINMDLNHVRMSLKASHLDPNYRPPMTFEDLQIGQTIVGKVRKVQEYGVFVVLDNSTNVSGLCHRSEMSDQRGANPTNLYSEGDQVQAKVLKIDEDTRRVSLGLKASYFKDESGDDEDSNVMSEVDISEDGRSDAEEQLDTSGVQLSSSEDSDQDNEVAVGMQDTGLDLSVEPMENGHDGTAGSRPRSLTVGGFDWTGGVMNGVQDPASDAESQIISKSGRRRRKAGVQIDMTGDLDTGDPKESTDFERRLITNRCSSRLWIDYMEFHRKLGEVEKARQIGQRALREIASQYQTEKQNVWTALLNLEVEYGDVTTVESLFQEASQFGDNLEMHEVLASIYILSKKYDEADALFQKAIKKHSQVPDIYLNYARFLMDQMNDPSRARALLPRAMQALPAHTHIPLTSKFARLEFSSPHGDAERGRTMFEGLLSTFPKKLDLRHVLLDLEINQGSQNRERVRSLFERTTGGAEIQLNKSRQISAFFSKWLAYEKEEGDKRSQEQVKAEREKALQAAQQRRATKAAALIST